MTNIKKYYFLLISLLLSINASGQVVKIDQINITDSTVIIDNGFIFSLPVSPDSLAKHLGNPRFKSGSPNSSYYWDTLGVMGFVPNNGSNITSFEICVSESNYLETTYFYHGKILIGDIIIDREMTYTQFSNVIKGKTKNFMPELTIGKMSLLVEFDEETNKLIGLAIERTVE